MGTPIRVRIPNRERVFARGVPGVVSDIFDVSLPVGFSQHRQIPEAVPVEDRSGGFGTQIVLRDTIVSWVRL